jgi:hypothetical protein
MISAFICSNFVSELQTAFHYCNRPAESIAPPPDVEIFDQPVDFIHTREKPAYFPQR